MGNIDIGWSVSVPEEALSMSASRSGGPGGQHVNTSSTRVTLILDLNKCDTLTVAQKHRIRHVAGNRATADDRIVLHAQEHRSQMRNREAALARLIELIREAVRPRPLRKHTRTPKRAHEKRIERKKRRSDVKKLRRKIV